MQSKRPFRLAAVFAVLLLALGAFALMHGGNDTPLNPIAQAAVRTQRASGGRISFRITARGPSLPQPVEMSGGGVFDGTSNRSRVTLSAPTPTGRIELEAVASGSHFYYRSEQLESDLPDGDEWVGLDLTLGSSSETGSVVSASPSAQLGMLRAVSDNFEKIGEKSVRGVETTGYRASFDPDRYVEYLRGEGSPKVAEQYERVVEAAPSTVELETWIDGRGLVRQTTFSSESRDPSSGEETSAEGTMYFYDFGISPDVQLPDSDTVYDLSPAVRSKLGLDGSS